MTMSAGFLGGARDRLLPASIPFRFFIAAAGFQVLAWATLFFASGEVPGFQGGLGMTLAAIHLVTLGVLTMTAIGACYQLLPVVTRKPLTCDWPPRLSFWLIFPGIVLLTYGMASADQATMKIGSILVCAGLSVFAIVTTDNLSRAHGVPVVSAHGWLALISLAIVVVLGLLLIWDYDAGFLEDHFKVAIVHMALASFGFMGLLVLGFSLVLIPMFVMSRSLPMPICWTQVSLAAFALSGFSIAFMLNVPVLTLTAFAPAFTAVGIYLWLMRTALRTGMRKRLGLPFVLMRTSWLFLVAGLLLSEAAFTEIDIPNAPALAGFFILVGWLLTFLTGVLQRIMPFLASMHIAGKSGMPPLLSDLTANQPLKIHAACIIAALLSCSSGILLDVVWMIQTGAIIGTIGAASFALFTINVALNLWQLKYPE